jgi:hypothetical protein
MEELIMLSLDRPRKLTERELEEAAQGWRPVGYEMKPRTKAKLPLKPKHEKSMFSLNNQTLHQPQPNAAKPAKAPEAASV